MGMIASDETFPGKVRRSSAIVNRGRIERIRVGAGNVVSVVSVEGQELYREEALRAAPGFIIQTITPVISEYGGTPHLVLVFGGFTEGSDTSRDIIVSTTYPVTA